MHLQVYPQDPKNPAGGTLRVWSSPEERYVLEDATDEQVLAELERAAAERARSAGVVAIRRARAENPAAPKPKPVGKSSRT